MKKHLPWFRLYSEAIDDDKLRLLAFEDRWHFIALLCCKAAGVIDEGGQLLHRRVAVKMGLDSRELGEVARRLAEVGLIDQDTLQPLAWNTRQFISDHDSAERMRRSRGKAATVTTNDCNGDVTVTGADTDTDTDTELDIGAFEKSNAPIAKPSKLKRKSRIPPEWEIEEDDPNHLYSKGKGMTWTEMEVEEEKFKNHHTAKGNVMLDWNAAWRTWVNNWLTYRKGDYGKAQGR